jgi:hypothetical protein
MELYPLCRKCKHGNEGEIPEGANVRSIGVPFRCSVNGKLKDGKCKKFELKK